jgi:hypothetical protein
MLLFKSRNPYERFQRAFRVEGCSYDGRLPITCTRHYAELTSKPGLAAFASGITVYLAGADGSEMAHEA